MDWIAMAVSKSCRENDFFGQELLLGRSFLLDVLSKNHLDLRTADLDSFRSWLCFEVERRREFDEIFKQKSKLRDLIKEHSASFSVHKKSLSMAEQSYQQSSHYSRLNELCYLLECNRKAQIGITDAMAEERIKNGEQKRLSFEDAGRELTAELDKLTEDSPEYQRLQRARSELRTFEEETEIAHERDILRVLQRQQGRKTSNSGLDFENFARGLIRRRLVPLFASQRAIHLLKGVTLGCARGELDYVLVAGGGDLAVEVLAIIEVKKNINDIAESFLTRQENIAWFHGCRSRYDSRRYQTKKYRSGHFDKPAFHEQGGESWRFEQGSFRGFRVDSKSDYYLKGLCFLSRDRPMRGANAGEQSRVLHSFATDFRSDLDDLDYCEELRLWMGAWLKSFQAPDVLKFYSQTEELARQIILIE
jgi:hypothetical protein